jgi:hypothetical protein
VYSLQKEVKPIYRKTKATTRMLLLKAWRWLVVECKEVFWWLKIKENDTLFYIFAAIGSNRLHRSW